MALSLPLGFCQAKARSIMPAFSESLTIAVRNFRAGCGISLLVTELTRLYLHCWHSSRVPRMSAQQYGQI